MNGYLAIQSVAWETGLQAVKDGADFDSFDAFVRHLQDGIRHKFRGDTTTLHEFDRQAAVSRPQT
jgi:hypothetical protein